MLILFPLFLTCVFVDFRVHSSLAHIHFAPVFKSPNTLAATTESELQLPAFVSSRKNTLNTVRITLLQKYEDVTGQTRSSRSADNRCYSERQFLKNIH